MAAAEPSISVPSEDKAVANGLGVASGVQGVQWVRGQVSTAQWVQQLWLLTSQSCRMPGELCSRVGRVGTWVVKVSQLSVLMRVVYMWDMRWMSMCSWGVSMHVMCIYACMHVHTGHIKGLFYWKKLSLVPCKSCWSTQPFQECGTMTYVMLSHRY